MKTPWRFGKVRTVSSPVLAAGGARTLRLDRDDAVAAAGEALFTPKGGAVVALLIFALSYMALYWAYMAVPNWLLGDWIYHYGIVSTGAMLINALAPAEAVQAVANRIVSPRAVLEVVRGCDGAGVLFLLSAAMLAVRARWRQVVGGVAGALLFVYALNQARIVVLYFAVLNEGVWFTTLHSVVFPSLFVLLALAYFTWWAGPRSVPGPTSHAA